MNDPSHKSISQLTRKEGRRHSLLAEKTRRKLLSRPAPRYSVLLCAQIVPIPTPWAANAENIPSQPLPAPCMMQGRAARKTHAPHQQSSGTCDRRISHGSHMHCIRSIFDPSMWKTHWKLASRIWRRPSGRSILYSFQFLRQPGSCFQWLWHG